MVNRFSFRLEPRLHADAFAAPQRRKTGLKVRKTELQVTESQLELDIGFAHFRPRVDAEDGKAYVERVFVGAHFGDVLRIQRQPNADHLRDPTAEHLRERAMLREHACRLPTLAKQSQDDRGAISDWVERRDP